MTRSPWVAGILAMMLATSASAQRLPPSAIVVDAPRLSAGAALALPPPTVQVSRDAAPPSRGRTVLYSIGGAAVGAWFGFVASQAARSDWNKRSDGEFTRYRLRFAAGGAVLGGTITALTLHRSRPRSRPLPGGDARPQWAGARGDAIGPDEIARSGARDAYDLVAGLRPTWLRLRGDGTFHDAPNGTVSGSSGGVVASVLPGDGGPKVYLNTGLLGGVESLHEIPLASLTEVRLLTPAEASYRFGHGYPDGVILLSTEAR
jgi:hypothetical protein